MEGGGDLQLSDNEQQQYLDKIKRGISAQLNEMIKDLEIKYNDRTKRWKKDNDRLKSDVQDLEDRVASLNRENEGYEKEKRRMQNKYQSLRGGIDQILSDNNSKNKEQISNLRKTVNKLRNERDDAIRQASKVMHALFFFLYLSL